MKLTNESIYDCKEMMMKATTLKSLVLSAALLASTANPAHCAFFEEQVAITDGYSAMSAASTGAEDRAGYFGASATRDDWFDAQRAISDGSWQRETGTYEGAQGPRGDRGSDDFLEGQRRLSDGSGY
jgi:hypothetical protein